MIKFHLVKLFTVLCILHVSSASVLPNIREEISLNADCLNKTIPLIVTSRAVAVTSSVVVAEAKESCEPDFKWDGTTCVKSHVTGPTCSDNFELVDGTCRYTQSSECPDGYHRDTLDGECVYRKVIDITCPPDHEWTGERCVRTVPGVCQDGFELEDGQCVQVQTKPAECPDGFKLTGTQCLKIVETQCAEGEEMIDGACTSYETGKVTYECPPDTIQEGKKCINRTQECPEGFVKNGTVCINVTVTCPPNSTLNSEKNQCIPNVCPPIPPRCELGYALVNGSCFPITCQPDHVLVNRTVCVLPCEVYEAICPTGSHLKDGWCYDVRGDISVPVRPTCTDGYVLQGSLCVRILSNKNCTVIPERNQTCPNGYLLVNNKCERQAECLPGYILKNNECIQVTPVPPICKNGYVLRDNKCYEINIVKPECPKGWTFHNDGLCYNDKPICPQNHTLIDGQCVHNQYCSLGFSFRNGTCQPDGVTPICPPNYYLVNGECVCTAPVPIPTTTTTPRPQPPTLPPQRPECPFGTKQEPDGNCYPIIPVCRPGYHFRDGACYPNNEPNIVTPKPNDTTGVTCQNSGATCTHHIINTVNIDKPVNVNTQNENNIIVHLYENGRKIQITRNNETQYIPIDDSEVAEVTDSLDDIESETEVPTPKCCQVVSPRKCTKVGDEWQCTQRETRRCGWFCTKSTIYLKPRRTIYQEPTLVMRPPPSWYRWGHYRILGNSIDCSGCISGGYSCSRECYQYTSCSVYDDCAYVDQRQFCQAYGGEGCSEQDGCLDQE